MVHNTLWGGLNRARGIKSVTALWNASNSNDGCASNFLACQILLLIKGFNKELLNYI